jgi:hypothetical protein
MNKGRTGVLLLAGLLTTVAVAQCTPDPLYTDSIFGVWPDTLENFAAGTVGMAYSDTLNLLTPANAGDIDPLFSLFTIDSIALDSASGLPPGLAVICNSQTSSACTYLPEQLGCGLIQGTPLQAGTFPITLNVTAYAHAPLFGNQVLPQVFTGYTIIVSGELGVETLAPLAFSHVRNVPNPVTDRTNIEFNLAKAGEVKVKVYDLVGAELWTGQLLGKPGLNRMPFEATKLESGIYLYTVSSAGTSFTGRMVVGR